MAQTGRGFSLCLGDYLTVVANVHFLHPPPSCAFRLFSFFLCVCLSFPCCFTTGVLTECRESLHCWGTAMSSYFIHMSLPNHVAPPFLSDPRIRTCDRYQETWCGLCWMTGSLAGSLGSHDSK